MAASPKVETAEELRESLLALRQDFDDLVDSSGHAQQLLDALESLLVDSEDDPFTRVFESLRKLFTFSQALMLVELDKPSGSDPDQLECIVADPKAMVGTIWPAGPLFRKVMNGRVATTFSNVSATEWQGPHIEPLSADQSALYVPVRVRDKRGILLLLRSADEDAFQRTHVGLAKHFSILVSHALATRFATQSATERRKLRELTAQLKASEQTAKRNLNLLNEVVNALPVGVAVQDAHGKLQVVNGTAAQALGRNARELLGISGSLLFGDRDDRSADRHTLFREFLHRGKQRTRECEVVIESKTHTLLVTDKPVRILDESLLLSTTLDITQRKHFEQELSRQAFHDQLTGLPNRTLMREIVDGALKTHARDGMFALAFIDLDNFKNINDYYSHAIGDVLLTAVAERINSTVRTGDILARISGDEFILLINPLKSQGQLVVIIERVLEALKQPYFIEGHEILTSASVGASIFPLHGKSYETLRRCADNAMYRAKMEHKGTVRYFDPSMSNALTARMDLEQLLRTAIRERRFQTAYQPKVSIHTGEVVGFEGLSRWVDVDGAVRLPGTFIGLATELGLLDDIAFFVLEDIVSCLPDLRQAYGDDISISVNIAAKQAGDIQFMDSVIARLENANAARHVVLELTEDALVATQHFQHQVLPKLRAMGVRVSIDDFGTGFSSLSILADITADEIKVDRAFITAIHERPRSQGILKAIESLCRALRIEVVAEGVETAEELAYLREHTTIDCAQGYYFARPQFIDVVLGHKDAPGVELRRASEGRV